METAGRNLAAAGILALLAAFLFSFSYAVNGMYPAKAGSLNVLQNTTMAHYTGDTFRHLDPVARIFAGQKGVLFIDTEWAKWQVMIFRPVYPFMASALYRLTGDLSASFAAVNLAFFVLLALSAFLLAGKLGMDDRYSLLVAVFVLSNPVTLVYSTLFMPDMPLLATGTMALLLFWKAFTGKNEPAPTFALMSAVVLLMVFTKVHYVIYLSAPLILYALGTRNRKALIYSTVIPLAAGILWAFIINDAQTAVQAITRQYAFVSGNMGCPSCKLDLFSRIIAFLSVAFPAILFYPLGVWAEKNRQRLMVLSAIIVLTIAVASSGYIGSLKRYYLPLLFPVTFYGVMGMRTALQRLVAGGGGERSETRAIIALAAIQLVSSIVIILAKYHGFSDASY